MDIPKPLSASAIAKFLECPQKYKFSYIDKIKEPPSWQMYLGSFVHEVLEHLYKQPAGQRNIETLKELAAKLWTENDWPGEIEKLPEMLGSLGDFKSSAFDAMTNLWALEDPSIVELDHMELEINTSIDGVELVGFIDRIASDPDGSVVISDYKTGKIPDPRFISDDQKWFQLLLYAAMYEATTGKLAKRLEYYYLAKNIKHEIEVSNEMLQVAKEVVVSVRRGIDEASAAGEFSCNVTNLCNWCHYKKIGICPAHIDHN
jgi:putative RecB family exonuclease